MVNHTFAICAYGESPFLEQCIQSVVNQTIPSKVFIATSTPNDFISNLAQKYGISVKENKGERGITQDWNNAISLCETPLVTLAHQDDLYFETFSESVVSAFSDGKNPLILFSDYYEIKKGNIQKDNSLLRIKRLMLWPLKCKLLQRSIWVRRRILSMGSPICCPSVTYNLEMLEQPIFNNHFRTNEDWEAWEKISKKKGSFIYIPVALMAHRIHSESETTKMISETNGRSEEDLEMFSKFWPNFVARFLVKKYKKSEELNVE